MAKQNYGGVYANMDFPPYEYIPYPRHVITGPNGMFEVANSEEEEKKIKDRLRKQRDEAPEEVEAYIVDPEKEILISRARELGVPINRKWSKQKLEQVVGSAEAETDNLPPEEPELLEIDNSELVSDSKELEALVAKIGDSEEDKEVLLEKAKELGLAANRLWGIPRLKAAISEAINR